MVGLLHRLTSNSMDQSDIKYVLEILTDSKINNDWDAVDEAIETLREFLDENIQVDDE